MRRLLERRFRDRIIRAARLEVSLFERLATDRTATEEAIGVVVLSSLAAGIAAMTRGGAGALVVGTVVSLVGWSLWALLTYLIAARMLPGPRARTDVWEWMRPLGFSAAPGLLRVVGILPSLTEIIFIVAGMWMLLTMVIAVQAVDFSRPRRAVAVSLLGWILYVFVEYLWFPTAVA